MTRKSMVEIVYTLFLKFIEIQLIEFQQNSLYFAIH